MAAAINNSPNSSLGSPPNYLPELGREEYLRVLGKYTHINYTLK
jgi:hypothetical protein|tara:strand:- start:665 stop:796 length:132 start_codon:yes stop_codon:yes gene_type:complete